MIPLSWSLVALAGGLLLMGVATSNAPVLVVASVVVLLALLPLTLAVRRGR